MIDLAWRGTQVDVDPQGPGAYWLRFERVPRTPAQRRDIADRLVMKGFRPADVYPMAGLALPSTAIVNRLRALAGLPAIEA